MIGLQSPTSFENKQATATFVNGYDRVFHADDGGGGRGRDYLSLAVPGKPFGMFAVL
jgi:hypothetical protein